MSSIFQDSVILITSRDPNLQQKRAFGTGFVIYRTNEATYLLTCAHVVRDVGGAEKVLANGIPATVVVSGESKGFDLAVLRVEGLWSLPILPLSPSGQEAKPFEIAGFYAFDQKETRLLRKIQGYLGKQTFISSTDGSLRIKAWDLRIEGEDILQPGYSGSPVVDLASRTVLAMVSHQVGKGEKGLAIAIEAIKQIWSEMPFSLLSGNVHQTHELPSPTEAIKVFLSYSPKDEKLREDLEESLYDLEKDRIWHQGKIRAGQNRKDEIHKHLNSAHIILLLISRHFIASEYHRNFEVKQAMERRNTGEAHVIPVLLSPVAGWQSIRFGDVQLGDLQYLPRNGKFVTDSRFWKNQNEAFFNIAEEFAEAVEQIAAESS